jgi:outer membrane protein
VRTSIDSRRHRQPQPHSYQATLAQPLFRADRWFQCQAAKDVNEQAALQLSATEQNLILQTAESYFNVLRSQDNLASTKAEEAAFKRQLDQSNERFDVGLSDKTDVLQSQASYDTARANRIVAQRQVDDAFEALITLTNRQYNSIQGIVHTCRSCRRRRTTPRPGSKPPPNRTSICWPATTRSAPPRKPSSSARPATRRPSTPWPIRRRRQRRPRLQQPECLRHALRWQRRATTLACS